MSQHSPDSPQTPLLGSGILRWFGILTIFGTATSSSTFLTASPVGSVRPCVPGSRQSPISQASRLTCARSTVDGWRNFTITPIEVDVEFLV